jgi:4'-phosphopantetheinyl transferase
VRFALVRSALRAIVGTRIGVRAADVRFEYGPWGKPAVAGEASLHVSVSHAHYYSLIALAEGAPVGIDLERLRRVPDADAIVRAVYPQDEVGRLAALEPGERDLAFISAWTRREALLKGLGCGLRSSPREVAFSRGSQSTAVSVVGLPAGTDLAEAWSVQPLDLPEGYLGALAVREPHPVVRQHLWRDGMVQ